MNPRLHHVSMTLAPLALIVALLTPATAQAQNTCTVTTLADDDGAQTLRARIDDPSCAVINFSVEGTITAKETLGITRDLRIDGPGPGKLTISLREDAEFPGPVFGVLSGSIDNPGGPLTVALNGLTITNGRAIMFGPLSGAGGGVVFYNQGTLTLDNSVVSGNRASVGAGISAIAPVTLNSNLTLTNSVVSGNTVVGPQSNFLVGLGSGIFALGSVTLIDSTVSGNSAEDMSDDSLTAGTVVLLGTLTLTNSTVSGNDGVGIFAESSTLTSSTVSGNGSLGIRTYDITLTNSTVSGNGSSGIQVWKDDFHDGSVLLVNSTVTGNGGPGIEPLSGGVNRFKNSLIANNAGGDCLEFGPVVYHVAGTNYHTDGTCQGVAQVTAEALNLGPLTNNGGPTQTHALRPGSVAIDTAFDCTDWNSEPIATDQRGVTRPRGAACDAGAFELAQAQGPVFSGFLPPVAKSPGMNFVKAGQAIPVKFRLGGDFGLNVLASGSPTSQQVACSLSSNTSTVTETVTAGKSGLSYDPATQTYSYVWKTEKSWASSCRNLTITFSDGSLQPQTVLFNFTK